VLEKLEKIKISLEKPKEKPFFCFGLVILVFFLALILIWHFAKIPAEPQVQPLPSEEEKEKKLLKRY